MQSEPAILSAYPLRETDAAGRHFSYREAGSGPALVLLHGIGSGSGSWGHQLAAFSGSHRVVAWDAPGYGGSANLAPPSPVAADYASALQALLDTLGIERCLLLGHSLGALMAASFAADRPDRVAGLVLADPARGYGDAAEIERKSKLYARLAQIDRLGPEGLARERGAALLGPDPTPDALALVRWNMARLRIDGHDQAARLLSNGILKQDVGRWQGPLLVLWGAEDTITPPAACRSVAEGHPTARTAEIAGAGHASYVDRPLAFNDLLRDFAGGLDT